MTSARIRRGESARPRARAAPRSRRAKPSAASRMLASLPVEPDTVRRVTAWGGFGVAAAVLIGTAWISGLFGMAWIATAEAMGRAGLSVEHIEVQGVRRMDSLTVYAVALDQRSTAMPLVELEPIRRRLLGYGWIADARVSRRLPDTLVIDIVEREPAAVWQHRGRLMLVDASGVVLAPVALDAMPDLPLVIGAEANRMAAGLERLVAAAPAIRPMLASANWVGGRRWDLRFQSGEVLALPEGAAAAEAALVRFVGMDARDRLLGRGFERFDMRDPTRMVVRINRDRPTIDRGEGSGADGGSTRVATRATT